MSVPIIPMYIIDMKYVDICQFSLQFEPINTNIQLNYMYSLIVQVYDGFETAWLKLPKADVGKLLSEECQNLILSNEVLTNEKICLT